MPAKIYAAFDDKTPPDKNYFDELFRVSKNQIIWGGNYFLDFLGRTKCMIFWDKERHDMQFADGEIAWTSFDAPTRRFKFLWNGMQQADMKNKETRIHPTQKPIALYKWLLKNFAKPGDKILDTHVGSGSIRIACHDMGFDFTGCEISEHYFNAQEERYKKHCEQGSLFEFFGGQVVEK